MSHSQRIKIVYLLRTLNIGGAERYVVETATGLNQARFEPKIYCIAGDGPLRAEAERQGVAVSAFAAPPGRQTPVAYARKFLALRRYLKQEQPDIVHPFMYTPSLYGAVAAKLTGQAIILTNRMRLGAFKEGLFGFQFWENRINRFVDGVLVNSRAVQADVLRRERIAPEKVHVIYGGVDIRKYQPLDGHPAALADRRRTRAAFGIPADAPVIGVVGNLFWHKGYREFLLAAADVHRDHPDAYFLCIGQDRGIQAELERMAETGCIRPRVIFTGQVRQIEAVYPALDLQVSASHEEGFSSAILEGMAAGKPIVATAVGGNVEAVVHDETGLLVSPKDPAALAQAIRAVLDQPERAAQFGRNGRRRVETHFSTEQMVRALEALYLDVYRQKA